MINRILAIIIILILSAGCEKEGYNYDRYLHGTEIIYPGKVTNLSANPGNLRIQLMWYPSSDRSITRYVIYYNTNRDSLIINANGETTADTVKAIVSSLREYAQDFALYTFDANGNRSVGQVLSAVKVYGPLYQSTLRNRHVIGGQLDGTENLIVNLSASLDTVHVTSKFTYQTTANQIEISFAATEANSITLPNWKKGTDVLVQSAYVPVRNSIDTFWVAIPDTLKGVDVPY